MLRAAILHECQNYLGGRGEGGGAGGGGGGFEGSETVNSLVTSAPIFLFWAPNELNELPEVRLPIRSLPT